MSILSPTGDQENNKHLWWRCVFIAAGIQTVLLLLFFLGLAACLRRALLPHFRLDLLFRVLAERERFLEKRFREYKKAK